MDYHGFDSRLMSADRNSHTSFDDQRERSQKSRQESQEKGQSGRLTTLHRFDEHLSPAASCNVLVES